MSDNKEKEPLMLTILRVWAVCASIVFSTVAGILYLIKYADSVFG